MSPISAVNLGPVPINPEQLVTLGQVSNLGVNFAVVHGLAPVSVQLSFSFPRGNLKRRVTHFSTPGNQLRRGNIFLVNTERQKLPQGKSSSTFAHCQSSA